MVSPPPEGPGGYPPQFGQYPPQYGQYPPQYGGQYPTQYGQYPPQYGQYGYPGMPYQQAPKPGSIPLRPLNLSEILDGSFRTIRRNPRTTLGFSAVIALLQAVIVTVFELAIYHWADGRTVTDANGTQTVSTATSANLIVAAFSLLVVGSILGAVLTGTLTLVVTEDVLGNPVSLAAVWARVRPRLWRLVVLSVVVGFVEILGLALFVAPGVWLWGIWAVAVPALMVEQTSIRGALGRSRTLVRRSFWRVWGIRALGILLVTAISSIITIPFTILAGLISGAALFATGGTGHPALYLVIAAVGTVVATTFTAPVKAGIDALLYVDLRMRREGLDIVLQQEAARRRPGSQGWTP